MARFSIRESLRFTSNFLSRYFKSNLHSSSTSYANSTLDLFESCRSTKHLYQIHANFITSGFLHNENPFLASRLLKCTTNFGIHIDYVVMIFRYIAVPDTVCVNYVIKAYSNSSVPDQGVVFYFKMLKNLFHPNSYTIPPLINSCAKSESDDLGRKCHGQIVKYGFDHVLPVNNSLIHMYGCIGFVEFAWKIFDEMPERDSISWNSMIDCYIKVNDFDTAHKLFDKMPDKNVISWNVMIGGYAKSEYPGLGLKLFREMAKLGSRFNDTTLVNVLTACGRSARVREGRSIHGSLLKTLSKSNLILNTTLIDMYSKCGKVDAARRIFDRTSKKNLVCWNAMILGHCISGYPKDGLDLFEKMVENDTISPDEVTFIGVLCACVRASLLNEGQNHFREMIDKFNVKPNFAHYWCMANLFANVGMIQEAEDSIRKMADDDHDISTQSLIWADLLGKCRFKKDVVLGEQVGISLIELEPENESCYALLLTVYAVIGRWDDVARIKQIMKERGVARIPGSSLVDLKELVHNFRVEDKNVLIAFRR